MTQKKSTFTEAECYKERRNSKLGISLKWNHEGDVVISRVLESCPFRHKLQQGMKRHKVNNKTIYPEIPLQEIQGLLQGTTGRICLTASSFLDFLPGKTFNHQQDPKSILRDSQTFIVAVSAPSSKVERGISFQMDPLDGSHHIATLEPGSKFSQSPWLKIGLQVMSLNGKPITGKLSTFVVKTFETKKPQNTILALRDPYSSGTETLNFRTVHVDAEHLTSDTKLGLGLLKVPMAMDQSVTVISNISKGSLFRQSSLKVGMVISKINGEFPSTHDELQNSLTEAKRSGVIHIEAFSVTPKDNGCFIYQEEMNCDPSEGPSSSQTHMEHEESPTREGAASQVSAEVPWNEELSLSSSSSTIDVPMSALSTKGPLAMASDWTTVTILKYATDDDLGLTLEENNEGRICIQDLAPNSPFQRYSQIMEAGDQLMSINSARVTGRGLSFVWMLLESIVGYLTLAVLPISRPAPCLIASEVPEEGIQDEASCKLPFCSLLRLEYFTVHVCQLINVPCERDCLLFLSIVKQR